KLGSFWHPAATAPVAPAARSTAAAAYSPALVMIGRISVLAPFVTIGGPSTRPRPRRGLLRDDIVGAVAAERLVGVAQRGHGDAADQGRDNVVDHALDDQQVGGPAKGGGQFLQAVHREHPLEDQPYQDDHHDERQDTEEEGGEEPPEIALRQFPGVAEHIALLDHDHRPEQGEADRDEDEEDEHNQRRQDEEDAAAAAGSCTVEDRHHGGRGDAKDDHDDQRQNREQELGLAEGEIDQGAGTALAEEH